MDDIWASFYVQSMGYKVFYDRASVYQKRNPHDLTIDFNKEIIGHQNNLQLLNDLSSSPENIKNYIPKISMKAFDEYRRLVN